MTRSAQQRVITGVAGANVVLCGAARDRRRLVVASPALDTAWIAPYPMTADNQGINIAVQLGFIDLCCEMFGDLVHAPWWIWMAAAPTTTNVVVIETIDPDEQKGSYYGDKPHAR